MKKRLKALLDNNVITEDIFNKLNEVLVFIDDKFTRAISKEKGEMFLTHLAMALVRVNDNEPIVEVDESIESQVIGDSNYLKADELASEIEDICEVEFTKEEKIFIVIHLCNLLL